MRKLSWALQKAISHHHYIESSQEYFRKLCSIHSTYIFFKSTIYNDPLNKALMKIFWNLAEVFM